MEAIRDLILDTGFTATERVKALKAYLNEHFPTYPPLSDWVQVKKEVASG